MVKKKMSLVMCLCLMSVLAGIAQAQHPGPIGCQLATTFISIPWSLRQFFHHNVCLCWTEIIAMSIRMNSN